MDPKTSDRQTRALATIQSVQTQWAAHREQAARESEEDTSEPANEPLDRWARWLQSNELGDK
jgi:hypothetical protein